MTLLGLRLQRCKHNSLLGDDHTFRIILVVAMLIFMPVAIYRRVRSQATARRSIAEEGPFILLTLRPIGIAVMVAIIAFVISPTSIVVLNRSRRRSP